MDKTIEQTAYDAAKKNFDAVLPKEIFGAYDIRGIAGRNLTVEGAFLVGKAVGTLAVQRAKKPAGQVVVAVGRDARISGPSFAEAMVQGIRSTGASVTRIGIVSTPETYFAAKKLGADGFVMITASHNPKEYNGYKCGLAGMALSPDEIQQVREMIQRDVRKGEGLLHAAPGGENEVDLRGEYAQFIRANVSVDKPLVEDAGKARPIRVVVDAHHGAGGPSAVAAYQALGAEVIGLFIEPDGEFPQGAADPSKEKNLQALAKAVREHGADLGLGLDGDADRCGAVDEQGRFIPVDDLQLLYAEQVLAENPGATVLGEVRSGLSFFERVRQLGGKALMSPAGHSKIKAMMVRPEVRSIYAAETSGHIFFGDREFKKRGWTPHDDGVLAGARLLEAVVKGKKKVSALLHEVQGRALGEVKLPEQGTKLCHEDASAEEFSLASRIKFDVVKLAEAHYRDAFGKLTVDGQPAVNTEDGVRVTLPPGTEVRIGDERHVLQSKIWFMIRPSNTEPKFNTRAAALVPGPGKEKVAEKDLDAVRRMQEADKERFLSEAKRVITH